MTEPLWPLCRLNTECILDRGHAQVCADAEGQPLLSSTSPGLVQWTETNSVTFPQGRRCNRCGIGPAETTHICPPIGHSTTVLPCPTYPLGSDESGS